MLQEPYSLIMSHQKKGATYNLAGEVDLLVAPCFWLLKEARI